MPTMAATKITQAPATARSRRRRLAGSIPIECFMGDPTGSQRPIEHARPELDDGDDIEQHHQGRQGQRDGDRARAPPALLLLGEHDPGLAVEFVHRAHPKPTPPSGKPPIRSASSVANNTNRYNTENANSRLAACSSAAPRRPRSRSANITIAPPPAIATVPYAAPANPSSHGASPSGASSRADRKSTRLNSSHIPLSRMP